MRRILLAVVVATGALLAWLTWERVFVERTIGPAAVAGLAFLALLFLLLLASYVLLGTCHRRMVANAWLTIASIGLTYALVDVTAGYFLIKPLSPPLVPDAYRHHRLVPNSHAQFTQRDFSYTQRVNNLGMRGEDRPIVKPPATVRIVTLGDSFTMGKGVEDTETFSVLLEQRLNALLAACSAPVRAEVLNGGVDSYAPILSYIQFAREIAPLRPDLVIHSLDVSDLVQEAAYRKQAKYTPNRAPIAVPQLDQRKTSMTDRARNWVERHLYLTRLVLYFANRVFGFKDLSVRDVVTQATFETAAHTLVGDSVDRSQQWADVFDSIGRLRDAAIRAQADYVLVSYPWGHQVNDREWVPGRDNFIPRGAVASDASARRLARFAEDSGTVFLDLLPHFRNYPGSEPLYFQYDNHLTVRGHRLMADGISEFLAGRLLKAWCSGERQSRQ